MTFSTSPCNPILRQSQIDYLLYKKVILSVILFEILLVIFAITYSAIKNQRQTPDEKEKTKQQNVQISQIQETSHNLKKQISPTTHSIFGGDFKSGKTLNDKKIIHQGCNNIQDIDAYESNYANEQPKEKGKLKSRIKKRQRMRRQAQKQNLSQQAQKNVSNQNTRFESSTKKIPFKKEKQVQKLETLQNQEDFINLLNLKLSKEQASTFFNIILGHFFIGAALAMNISPNLVSAIFSGVHCFLIILLLIGNIFLAKPKEKLIEKVIEKKQETKISQREIKNNEDETISIQFQVHYGNQNQNQNPKKKTQQIKQRKQVKQENHQKHVNFLSKLNYTILVLMLSINLYMLATCVMVMKQSYFNKAESRCA